MKNKLTCILALLLVVFAGCSSTDGAAVSPASGALAGTWKFPEEDPSAQIMRFEADGTGTRTTYDANGRETENTPLVYFPGDDTRFGVVGEKWVVYVPCEIQGGTLTEKTTGRVFTKQ
jgi:YD repeat-containing protein